MFKHIEFELQGVHCDLFFLLKLLSNHKVLKENSCLFLLSIVLFSQRLKANRSLKTVNSCFLMLIHRCENMYLSNYFPATKRFNKPSASHLCPYEHLQNVCFAQTLWIDRNTTYKKAFFFFLVPQPMIIIDKANNTSTHYTDVYHS